VTELDQAGSQAAAQTVRAEDGHTDAPVADGADRYLTFRLTDEVFALPIADITEIIEYRSLTAVPMMPSFVRGVLNLRGRVVPVVDLAARFGRGSTTLGRRTAIVIVETRGAEDGEDGPGQDFGIVVDAVNEVVHVNDADIEPAPAFGGGIRSDFIAGMARRQGDFVVVLDVARVLSVDEMIQLGQACLDGPVTASDGTAAAATTTARDGAEEVALSGAGER
jgi:purine-binding chemotaxis protein CheW